MKVKTFTLKEANKLIPTIKSIFDDIFVLRKKLVIMKGEMDWIREFWGKDLRDSDNPDGERYDNLSAAIEKLGGEIQKNVENLQKRGCVVKDINAGLVDFYSTVNSELVFLCWQYGEKEIQYWHSINGGFKSRRPFTKIDRIE